MLCQAFVDWPSFNFILTISAKAFSSSRFHCYLFVFIFHFSCLQWVFFCFAWILAPTVESLCFEWNLNLWIMTSCLHYHPQLLISHILFGTRWTANNTWLIAWLYWIRGDDMKETHARTLFSITSPLSPLINHFCHPRASSGDADEARAGGWSRSPVWRNYHFSREDDVLAPSTKTTRQRGNICARWFSFARIASLGFVSWKYQSKLYWEWVQTPNIETP